MRKFKIKNRQKRKYTRKNLPSSSLQLERGLFAGLLPLSILAVALATTMLISLNLREQQYAFEFSFQLPQISTAPAERFIQDIPSLLNEPTVFFSSLATLILETMITAVNTISSVISQAFVQILIALDPRPLFGLIANGVLDTGAAVSNFFTQVISGIGFGISYVMKSVSAFFILIGNAFSVVVTAFLDAVILAIDALIQAVRSIASVLFEVGKAIVHAIVTTAQFIAMKVNAFIDATLYFLGTPFRMLGAIWIQVKPYVDVFMSHVAMVGDDLANGFNSLNNFSSIISSSK